MISAKPNDLLPIYEFGSSMSGNKLPNDTPPKYPIVNGYETRVASPAAAAMDVAKWVL